MHEIRGRVAQLSGLSAEAAVERFYADGGQPVAARRWRGRGGEIDLIARDGEGLIFVEVKAARSHDEAAARVTSVQAQRVMAAAEEYVADEPLGLLTPMRFDVALVDAMGRIDVIRNAFPM